MEDPKVDRLASIAQILEIGSHHRETPPTNLVVVRHLDRTTEISVSWTSDEYDAGPCTTALGSWNTGDEFNFSNDSESNQSASNKMITVAEEASPADANGCVTVKVTGAVKNPGRVKVKPDASLSTLAAACGGLYSDYHHKKGFNNIEVTSIWVLRRIDSRTQVLAALTPLEYENRKESSFYQRWVGGDCVRLMIDR